MKAEQAGLRSEKSIIAERIAIANAQYQAALELADKGYAPDRLVDQRKETLLSLKQADAGMNRQLLNIEARIVEARNYIRNGLPYGMEEEQSSLRQRKEALTRQIADVKLSSHYSLVAPVSGQVTAVTKKIGETAVPGTPLIVIRPNESELIGKLLVPSRAAGLLKVGQIAKIQYDAFPYQRFGVFGGEVIAVSETVFSPGETATPIPMQEAYYVVELSLDSQSIQTANRDIFLKPGMLLKADIRLEERSLVEWIFDPILSLKGKL